jgi:hypothetical protein
MLAQNLETSKFDKIIEQAISYVEGRGFEEIKARHENYDNPASLVMQGSDTVFTPDITATRNGGKYYFEIADRTEKPTEVVAKWKLMSVLAKMKQGDFKIFVPYGSMKYANEIVERKHIDAELIKLSK